MFSVESILFKDANTTNNMVVNTQTSLKSTDEIYKDAAQAMEDLEFHNTYSKLSTYNNLQKLKMVKRLHGVTQNIRNKQAHNSCESYLSNLAYSIEEDQKNGEENKGEEKKEESSGKKDGNIIVRFFRWLKNMLKRFVEFLKSIWKKFVGFFKKEKENFNKEVKEEDKSPEISEVKSNPNESIFKEVKSGKDSKKNTEKLDKIRQIVEDMLQKYGGLYSLAGIQLDNITIRRTEKVVGDASNVVTKMKDNNLETIKTQLVQVKENISQLEERLKIAKEQDGSKLENVLTFLFSKGKDKFQIKRITDKNNISFKSLSQILSNFDYAAISKQMNGIVNDLDRVIKMTDKFIDICIKKVNDKDITAKTLNNDDVQKHNYSTDISKTDINTANKGVIHGGLTELKTMSKSLTDLNGTYTKAVNTVISYLIDLQKLDMYKDWLHKSGQI